MPSHTCLPGNLLLEVCSHLPQLVSHNRGLEPECPLSCCSQSRHSAFLKVNRKEGTWTDMYEQPSSLRSLPFRFPKSWCAHGFYNEKGFVCWRIFSALLLNSKVRREWGRDENYSALLCFAFPNKFKFKLCLQLLWNCSQEGLRMGSQKFQSEIGSLNFSVTVGKSFPFSGLASPYLFNERMGTSICVSFLICAMGIAGNTWLHPPGC